MGTDRKERRRISPGFDTERWSLTDCVREVWGRVPRASAARDRDTLPFLKSSSSVELSGDGERPPAARTAVGRIGVGNLGRVLPGVVRRPGRTRSPVRASQTTPAGQ